jgi:hypothetical protein
MVILQLSIKNVAPYKPIHDPLISPLGIPPKVLAPLITKPLTKLRAVPQGLQYEGYGKVFIKIGQVRK